MSGWVLLNTCSGPGFEENRSDLEKTGLLLEKRNLTIRGALAAGTINCFQQMSGGILVLSLVSLKDATEGRKTSGTIGAVHCSSNLIEGHQGELAQWSQVSMVSSRYARGNKKHQQMAQYQFDLDVHLRESLGHDWVLNSLIRMFLILNDSELIA